jgi:hypothetical protein
MDDTFKSGNSNERARIYIGLTEEQKRVFQALPIQQQIRLLAVPIKNLKRFERDGLDSYISFKVNSEKSKDKYKPDKWTKIKERARMGGK